ncbi:MBL fold metallo-hydrolase RNA specificity domain-containing protein, partial [Klebsiella pneumoniae]
SRLHASGHAGEADLVALVREVRPQVLIPVHTESPGRWREVLGELGGTRVFLPQEGERVDLEGLLRG